MTLKILGWLIVSYFLTVISGFFSTVVECFLFQNSSKTEGIGILILGFLIAILLPGLISGFIFLPLSLFGRKTITQLSFKELFKRYLPLIILPFSIILVTLIILMGGEKGDIGLLMIFAGNAYFISTIALVIFLKLLKLKL